MAAARNDGLVRFIGVTGHGTRIAGMHSRSLERFDFDSVLLPYNFTMLDNPAYRPTSRRSWKPAPSDASLCRPSSPSHAAGGATSKTAASAGTNRSKTKTPSSVLFSTSSENPQVFLNTTSDARKLATIFAAAQGTVTAPHDDAMRSDTKAHGITPLFDGSELERI